MRKVQFDGAGERYDIVRNLLVMARRYYLDVVYGMRGCVFELEGVELPEVGGTKDGRKRIEGSLSPLQTSIERG